MRADAASVRVEEPLDAVSVRDVNELAFGAPLEADLVERLRGTAGAISLVAVIDGTIAGHIFFTPVSIDPPGEHRVAGLGPMSVRPDRQRAGVGGQLVRAGLESCRRHGYAAVVVVGHPTYYPRFGFEPAHLWGLSLPDFAVPQEAFMVVALEPGVRGVLSGAVRYRPEFAAV